MNYDKKYFQDILPNRPQNSHKGTFGHCLNIAGSEFYSGAAYFSSVAALKVGGGKVTLTSENDVLKAIASLSPDIILMPIENLNKNNIVDFDLISIGCGLSQNDWAVNLFKRVMNLLENSKTPVVIDADGLNILSTLAIFVNGEGNSEDIKLPQNLILTPHPKEMSRLMGVCVDEILKHPEFWVKECAKKFNCTAILKLHRTLVADKQGNFYQNNTGNSALAKGGSGDVLTGMITGFIAQGVRIFDACCLAVYLHGVAGEIASEDLTQYSTLASDLINYIPKAIKKLLG